MLGDFRTAALLAGMSLEASKLPRDPLGTVSSNSPKGEFITAKCSTLLFEMSNKLLCEYEKVSVLPSTLSLSGFSPKGEKKATSCGFSPKGEKNATLSGFSMKGEKKITSSGHSPKGEKKATSSGFSPKGEKKTTLSGFSLKGEKVAGSACCTSFKLAQVVFKQTVDVMGPTEDHG